MKTKYPVNREFFPLNHFIAPSNLFLIKLSQKHMNPPGFLWKDPDLQVETKKIPAYQGGEILLYILSPKTAGSKEPCLVNYHGGGFLFEGWNSHYKMATLYAKGANCKVVFVRYRLAPDHPFPVPQEDCYQALLWVHGHAEELGIDPDRIGVAGDSAGGALSVTSCLMARDRGDAVQPVFQMLFYPWLDGRSDSESHKRFTDVPMWNAKLSEKITPYINPQPENIPLAYRSPVEADTLEGMPPAYIEVAEFDSLHDDGVLYAERLKEAGIACELHETKGTIHGFDTKVSAPTSQKMIAQRIAYMRAMYRPHL